WDSIGWATGLPSTPLRIRRLPLSSAALRFRGFSTTEQPVPSSPEMPDYSRITATCPTWLDLQGYYTRYGDVLPLLQKVDDRYVIMNAGDELMAKFAAQPPPAAGWQRDYVLVGDGWEKDGNFNTAFSSTVLPLPSHSMRSYSTPPGRLQDDPVYRRHWKDWVTYHTRYITSRPFHDAMLPLDR
ncbi:MAG TPA: hypothetical protein VGS41_04600, partial [Chthonomonadales bacterium]|nr:hypothetical protein [Chthonomonadales bacterium]